MQTKSKKAERYIRVSTSFCPCRFTVADLSRAKKQLKKWLTARVLRLPPSKVTFKVVLLAIYQRRYILDRTSYCLISVFIFMNTILSTILDNWDVIVLYVLITCNLLFNLEMELYKKQGRITCYRTFMSTITETDGFFRKFDFHLIRLSFFSINFNSFLLC